MGTLKRVEMLISSHADTGEASSESVYTPAHSSLPVLDSPTVTALLVMALAVSVNPPPQTSDTSSNSKK